MSAEPTTPASTEGTVLTESSAGHAVTIRSGQLLRLALPETPTTGYRWSLQEPCVEHLDLKSDTAAHPDAQIPGAPGLRTWVFHAKAPGACEIRLVSGRSWEKAATGRELSFPVRIAP